VNGSYIWAQAYYLLRCGFPDESLALLSDNQHTIKRDDWSFPGCYKTYLSSPDRRLPKFQRDQLFNDFNATLRNNPSVDQFKYALYKLVGRFELNRKSLKVAATTEDWMWLQLSLVRESREAEAPQEQYDLSDLGRLVLKYGNDKFDANGTRPFAWFNLLLFTAQFERVRVQSLFSLLLLTMHVGRRVPLFEGAAQDRRGPLCDRPGLLRPVTSSLPRRRSGSPYVH
jgi:nuclear pore complex protein Nup93